MENLLVQIFENVVSNDEESYGKGTDYAKEFDDLIEEAKTILPESPEEIISDIIYSAAYLGEKQGFVMGAKFLNKFNNELKDKIEL